LEVVLVVSKLAKNNDLSPVRHLDYHFRKPQIFRNFVKLFLHTIKANLNGRRKKITQFY